MHSKWFALSALTFLFLAGNAVLAQEMPTPKKEHAFLKNLAGEWKTVGEMHPAPGAEPIKGQGNETGTMLGEFWVVTKGKSEIMGMQMESVFTLGYDGKKEKYVGTWVDSMTDFIWQYEGTVDESGKVLTLLTEGPSMIAPGKTCKYRETITIKSPDLKVFSSEMQGEDGKWINFAKMTATRKK